MINTKLILLTIGVLVVGLGGGYEIKNVTSMHSNKQEQVTVKDLSKPIKLKDFTLTNMNVSSNAVQGVLHNNGADIQLEDVTITLFDDSGKLVETVDEPFSGMIVGSGQQTDFDASLVIGTLPSYSSASVTIDYK